MRSEKRPMVGNAITKKHFRVCRICIIRSTGKSAGGSIEIEFAGMMILGK
jgi:hypothetical protein